MIGHGGGAANRGRRGSSKRTPKIISVLCLGKTLLAPIEPLGQSTWALCLTFAVNRLRMLTSEHLYIAHKDSQPAGSAFFPFSCQTKDCFEHIYSTTCLLFGASGTLLNVSE